MATYTQVTLNWLFPKTPTQESGTVVSKSAPNVVLNRSSSSKDRYSPIPRPNTSTPIIHPSTSPTFTISQERDQFVSQMKTLDIPSTQTPLAHINVPELQESLWKEYQDGKLEWSDMMNKARRIEREGRARVLEVWKIQKRAKGESYNAADSKTDQRIVYLDGSDPVETRGPFSDLDLTANTLEAWDKMRETAQKMGYKTEADEDEDIYFFRIPALNAVIWRPRPGGDSILPGDPDFVKYAKFSATNIESVDPSSVNPTFSIENVIAMANKGQVGFSKPVDDWGSGYIRYETLIQMAKATSLAMKNTGLSEKKPDDYNRLFKLCKMKQSPAELGIFKRGASEGEIKAGLEKEQKNIRALLTESFELSREQLEEKMDQLQARMKEHEDLHKTHAWSTDETVKKTKRQEFKTLLDDVKDAHKRLDKLAIQLQAQSLSEDHKNILQHLFIPHQLAATETNRKRRNSLFTTAYLDLESQLIKWQRKLSSFLEAEQIAHSPIIEHPFQYDWRETLLGPIDMVPTPPPPSLYKQKHHTSQEEAPVERHTTLHRRPSIPLTLTPTEEQPLLLDQS